MIAARLPEEDIHSRDVYQSRLEELKAIMEESVPAPSTYHTGGLGRKHEGYHFKETRHLGVYPHPHKKLDDPKMKERIKALGVQHME